MIVMCVGEIAHSRDLCLNLILSNCMADKEKCPPASCPLTVPPTLCVVSPTLNEREVK